MLSFFKSNKKKTPKKGRAFYERENLIQTIDELKILLNLLDSDKPTKSDANFLFQGKELDTISEKNLDKDFGEESFLLEPDNNVVDHIVYYYRITSGHLRFLIQIHFIKSEFFLASTKVYSDSLLSKNDKQKVVSRIVSKYSPEADEDTLEFNIKDPIGNILYTKDDVYYYINYLANNSVTKELKRKYADYLAPSPVNEIKDTLDNLI